MPIQMAVDDILSVRTWFALDEQAAVSTWNYKVISITGAGSTDQDLANLFDLDFNIFFKDLVPSTVSYRGVQVYFLNRGVGIFLPAPVSAVANSGFGTAPGGPVPRNTAPILKYSTVIRGPRGRGRIFLPFVAAGFVASNGRPTVAFEVLLNSAASNFLNPLVVGSGGNTTTLVWSLIHKVKGVLPVSTGQIVNAQSADKFGQMHKRGDYGRANSSPI